MKEIDKTADKSVSNPKGDNAQKIDIPTFMPTAQVESNGIKMMPSQYRDIETEDFHLEGK